MSLKKAKRDITNMKKSMGLNNEPTLPNFFRFCRRYYGREVHCGELWFDTYKIRHNERMVTAKSNPLLFFRLSEEYFTKLHNVRNPVKDHHHGLKGFMQSTWHEEIYTGPKQTLNWIFDDKEYNKWFEEFWQELKKEFDKINLDDLPGALYENDN